MYYTRKRRCWSLTIWCAIDLFFKLKRVPIWFSVRIYIIGRFLFCFVLFSNNWQYLFTYINILMTISRKCNEMCNTNIFRKKTYFSDTSYHINTIPYHTIILLKSIKKVPRELSLLLYTYYNSHIEWFGSTIRKLKIFTFPERLSVFGGCSQFKLK